MTTMSSLSDHFPAHRSLPEPDVVIEISYLMSLLQFSAFY